MNTLVFIHGLESTARGTKGQFFRKNFPQMIIENYTGDFAARMRKLRSLLDDKTDLIIVGSSYGGLMAVQYAVENEHRMKKLVLLAPALNVSDFTPPSRVLKVPVVLYHGSNDDIVDPEKVKNIAFRYFTALEYHLVPDDHVLHETFPSLDWKKLLTAG
ncbi:MAG TPA: alpha/beta fold hydrolase [Smithella sp.]|nr:alpha/beta fold hydrolase [Smithella sp.]